MESKSEHADTNILAEVHDIFSGRLIDAADDEATSKGKLVFTKDIGNYGWQEKAACQDESSELFFSDEVAMHRMAARICEKCVVVEECLDFAERNDELYVWGGTYHTRRADGLSVRNRTS